MSESPTRAERDILCAICGKSVPHIGAPRLFYDKRKTPVYWTRTGNGVTVMKAWCSKGHARKDGVRDVD